MHPQQGWLVHQSGQYGYWKVVQSSAVQRESSTVHLMSPPALGSLSALGSPCLPDGKGMRKDLTKATWNQNIIIDSDLKLMEEASKPENPSYQKGSVTIHL